MLNNVLSIDCSFKLLERTFRVLLRSIDRKVQKVLLSKAAVMEMSLSQVVESEAAPCLRIARTTLPDNRLDFNQTFQQIRFGLDEFYRERNPIFNNSPIMEVEQGNPATTNIEQKLLKTNSPLNKILEIYHKEDCTTDNSGISPLWIAKTTLPDERLDFNKTFLNIRTEIDKFYKAQNPGFDNNIPPQFEPNQSFNKEQQLNIYKSRRLIEQGIQSNAGEQKGNLPEPITPTNSYMGTPVPDRDSAMEFSFQQNCHEIGGNAQEKQLIINKNIGELGLKQTTAKDRKYLWRNRQKTGGSSKLVGHTLTDSFKNRKVYSHHLRRVRKNRGLPRPVRMAWNFKDQKESLQEKIPDASINQVGSSGQPANIIMKIKARAS